MRLLIASAAMMTSVRAGLRARPGLISAILNRSGEVIMRRSASISRNVQQASRRAACANFSGGWNHG